MCKKPQRPFLLAPSSMENILVPPIDTIKGILICCYVAADGV
jgi:hypothetical protein